MIGYAGRNNTLRDKDNPVRCNRGMQKKTWKDRGLEYAGKLTEKNFSDLLSILRWNKDNGIEFYRCTSQSFVPWNSQYNIDELPNIDSITEIAKECGRFIIENKMRLSFHPDYFVKPASTSKSTRDKARKSLENHGSWLDLMGLSRNRRYPINIHIGGHYGDMDATAMRFDSFMDTVSDSVSSRLVVENDDSPNLWSVEELVENVHSRTGCAITFDYHHHSFSSNGNSYREAFNMAQNTWNCKPVTHYSQPAVLHKEDDADRPQAHASYVSQIPDWLRQESDVMIECNGKEKAVLQFV
jgi:UV DNA damage endonuclease